VTLTSPNGADTAWGPGADREKQKRQNRQVGDTQNPWEQWGLGLLILAGLVLVVWFPLILLATPGTTTQNPPVGVKIVLCTPAQLTRAGSPRTHCR